MDSIKPVVTIDLLDIEVARVTVAAANLDGEIIGSEAEFGWPALGDGREQTEQRFSLVPRAIGRSIRHFVHEPRAVENQSERTFGIDFLGQ